MSDVSYKLAPYAS